MRPGIVAAIIGLAALAATGAPVTSTRVALVCVIGPGLGSAEKTVFRSADTGRTDRSAGQTPIPGITSEIAATRSGTLAVASSASRGSFVYLNTGGTRWTTPLPKPNDGGALGNDLVSIPAGSAGSSTARSTSLTSAWSTGPPTAAGAGIRLASPGTLSRQVLRTARGQRAATGRRSPVRTRAC